MITNHNHYQSNTQSIDHRLTFKSFKATRLTSRFVSDGSWLLASSDGGLNRSLIFDSAIASFFHSVFSFDCTSSFSSSFSLYRWVSFFSSIIRSSRSSRSKMICSLMLKSIVVLERFRREQAKRFWRNLIGNRWISEFAIASRPPKKTSLVCLPCA